MQQEIEMGKYAPLYEYLRAHDGLDEIEVTLEQVEAILGFALPPRARPVKSEWWTMHPTSKQALSWIVAGRRPLRDEGRVVFVRAEARLGDTAERHRDGTEQYVAFARKELDDGPPIVLDTAEQLRQWSPHEVYVIHFREAGLFKIGIASTGNGRPEDICRKAGALLLDRYEVANEWAAKVIEGEWLRQVRDVRVEPPLWVAQHAGVSEFWRDEVPAPSLRDYVLSLADDLARPHWSISLPPSVWSR